LLFCNLIMDAFEFVNKLISHNFDVLNLNIKIRSKVMKVNNNSVKIYSIFHTATVTVNLLYSLEML